MLVYSSTNLEPQNSFPQVTIWYRGAYTTAATHQSHNFLYTHAAYVSPRWVLSRDAATLHGVTPTHTWFCVTEDGVDLEDVVETPFLFVGQYEQAKRLVFMPHWAFNKLAAEVN